MKLGRLIGLAAALILSPGHDRRSTQRRPNHSYDIGGDMCIPKPNLSPMTGFLCAGLALFAQDAGAQTGKARVREQPRTERLVPVSRGYTGITPYTIDATVSTRPTAVLPPAVAVDLRPQIRDLGIPIRNQGARGTCSVYAITFVLEYVYTRFADLAYRNLSEEYLNRAANLASGNSGDGDKFENIDLGYQKLGVVTERAMPYEPTYDPNATLSPELLANGKQIPRLKPQWIKTWDNGTGATAGQLDKVLDRLRAGHPVAVGMWWPVKSAFATELVGGIPLMRDVGKSSLFDGHSVVLVGFLVSPDFPGGGYFVFRNSWGDGWDNGYGYISFAYIRKYANDLISYD